MYIKQAKQQEKMQIKTQTYLKSNKQINLLSFHRNQDKPKKIKKKKNRKRNKRGKQKQNRELNIEQRPEAENKKWMHKKSIRKKQRKVYNCLLHSISFDPFPFLLLISIVSRT